jgi:hypothetical protein
VAAAFGLVGRRWPDETALGIQASSGDRALAFPCDATGSANVDALSERERCNYFYARSVVGRDFAQPAVCRYSALH